MMFALRWSAWVPARGTGDEFPLTSLVSDLDTAPTMRAVTIIVQYLVRGVALAPLTSGELDRRSYLQGGKPIDEDARVVSLLDQQLSSQPDLRREVVKMLQRSQC